MKRCIQSRALAIFFGALSIVGLQPFVCSAQTTVITYQGRLNDGSGPANGIFDLRFTIFDASINSNLLAGPITNSAVVVSNGLFNASMDFGAPVFNGGDRWLEIAVRVNGSKNFISLTNRQQITSTPYAIQAQSAATAATVSSLPPNVALLNSSQLFSGQNTFGNQTFFLGGVGIGTPVAPSESLQVEGGILARGGPPGGFGSANNGYAFQDNGGDNDSGMYSLGNGQIEFFNDAIEAMRITGGNVGIGTTAPQSRLQVIGNIQLGGSGNLFAAGGQENLRIVRGTVNSSGTIIKGSGFTVSHPGPGAYNITFVPPFSDVPSVTVTAVDILARAGLSISASGVAIGTVNFSGTGADDNFHFIAVGPP